VATEIYELQVEGLLVSSYRNTILHFQGVGVSSGDTLAAAESLCVGWDGNIKTSFLDTLPAAYNLTQLVARRATPAPSAEGYQRYAMGTYGGTGGGGNASTSGTANKGGGGGAW